MHQIVLQTTIIFIFAYKYYVIFQFKMSRLSLVKLLTDGDFDEDAYNMWKKKLIITMAKEKHEKT